MTVVPFNRHSDRPTEDQRSERKVNAAYHRGYWQGYAHALHEASVIDAALVVVAFLGGFGGALVLVGLM